MTEQEKIYGLMAQAEDMQISAMGLIERAEERDKNSHKIAQEVFQRVEKAADKAIVKIEKREFLRTLMGVGILIFTGAFVIFLVITGSRWALEYNNKNLKADIKKYENIIIKRKENIEDLEGEIAELKKLKSQLGEKTWGIKLQKSSDGQRIIILKKGDDIANTGSISTGERAIILK